jgi:SAM-dependent methyltransferase
VARPTDLEIPLPDKDLKIEHLDASADGELIVEAHLLHSAAVSFALDAQVQVLAAEGAGIVQSSDLCGSLPVAWLPRGRYRLRARAFAPGLPAGRYRIRLIVFAEIARERVVLDEATTDVQVGEQAASAGPVDRAWSLESLPGTMPVDDLAWTRGHEDWFFRHFDHAALVVTDYLLQQNPMLRGRILDVGCGDGIIDLGIFLRMQPELLVGIDPFKGYERLPDALAMNGLPPDLLDDPRLQFRPEDANDLPFEDDHFDVVVSWGSLEHIAGGHAQALREIRRVLKRDGLLFAHPGLYYGALGNHLGEFFDDPFIHLKLPPEELREKVLGTEPQRMDRAGHVATPEEYWQWFTELNPITVAGFEKELRDLGFEPWRVALRSSDLVEYTPELQEHAMLDLATAELYLSAWNRKL